MKLVGHKRAEMVLTSESPDAIEPTTTASTWSTDASASASALARTAKSRMLGARFATGTAAAPIIATSRISQDPIA
jgi:hypothetical protein